MDIKKRVPASNVEKWATFVETALSAMEIPPILALTITYRRRTFLLWVMLPKTRASRTFFVGPSLVRSKVGFGNAKSLIMKFLFELYLSRHYRAWRSCPKPVHIFFRNIEKQTDTQGLLHQFYFSCSGVPHTSNTTQSTTSLALDSLNTIIDNDDSCIPLEGSRTSRLWKISWCSGYRSPQPPNRKDQPLELQRNE